MREPRGVVLATMLVVCLCVAIAVISVVGYQGDNAIENAANDVINKELGTSIDISDIMQRFDEPKE